LNNPPLKTGEKLRMPAIEIHDREQYRKALDVLIAVGGPFQGRGRDKRVLVVTESQYRALVDAGVVQPNSTKTRGRGQETRQTGTL
jgi:hypothetical protein